MDTSTTRTTKGNTFPGRTRLNLQRKPIEGDARPEDYSRIPPTRIRIKWDTRSQNAMVDESGIILINDIYSPSPSASDWMRGGRQFKQISVPCLPENAAICFHGGEQRVFVKHSPNQSKNSFLSSRLLLDLSSSSSRDVFAFTQPILNLVVFDSKTNETCSIEIELFSSMNDELNSVSPLVMDEVMIEDELFDNIAINTDDTSSCSPSTQVKIKVDGNECPIVVDSEKNDLNRILFGSTKCKDKDGVPVIQLPLHLENNNNILAGLQVDDTTGFILTPRLQKSTSLRLFAVLPDNVEFPVCFGDRIVVEAGGKKEALEFHVEMPRLCRSLEQLREEECAHPAQTMRAIALEVPVRAPVPDGSIAENPSTLRPTTVTCEYLLFTPRGDSFSIGRKSQEVFIPDPHLSKYHAQIARVDDQHFQMTPEGDRPVYMLLGKKELHHRPPTVLRKRDVITAGKSEFKVMLVQRGDLDFVPSGTAEEELLLRLRRSPGTCELQVKPEFKSELAQLSDVEYAGVELPVMADDARQLMNRFEDTQVNMNAPLLLLVGTRGVALGKFFLCDPIETIFGTGPQASICVAGDRRMGSVHFRVYFDCNQREWVVQDLQSRHGTFLKIEAPFNELLSIGDVMVMGESTIRVMGELGSPGGILCGSGGKSGRSPACCSLQ